MNTAADSKINEAFVALSEAYAGNLDNPYPVYAEHREKCPVYDGDLIASFGVPSMVAGRDGNRRVFCLLGHEVVSRALMDSETFSSEIYREAFGGVMGDPVILYLQGREHRFHRNLLTQILSPAAMKDLTEKHFKPTIDGMVRDVAHRCQGELMADFILDFPIRVIYKLFGLPSDNQEEMDAFANRALVMVLGGMIDPRKPEEAQQRMANAAQASGELFDQIVATVKRRRAEGDTQGSDLISQLIRYNDDSGKTFSDEEIAQELRPTLAAAGETTSRGFANVLALLLERPHILEQVRNDRSLIPTVINEAMRFEGSVSVVPRITSCDTEMAGVTIPAGSGINILVGSANRDPAVHNNPEEFSLEKRNKQPLSFGFGPHMCMGMPLAKNEMSLALNAVLDHMPNIRFDPEGDYQGIKGVQFRSPASLPVVWDTP